MHKSTSVSDRVVTPTCSQLRWAAGRTAAECRHPSSPPYQPCLPTPPATPTHYLTRRKREYAFLSSFSNRLTWHLLLRPHFDPVLLIEVSRSEDDAAAFHIHRLQEEMSFIENLKTWNCSLEKWTGLGWTLVWFMLKVPGRPHYSSIIQWGGAGGEGRSIQRLWTLTLLSLGLSNGGRLSLVTMTIRPW